MEGGALEPGDFGAAHSRKSKLGARSSDGEPEAAIRLDDSRGMSQPLAAQQFGRFGRYIYTSGDMGKYFGCRLGDAARTWHRLGLFGKSAACAPRWMTVIPVIYDAVIRSKAVTGWPQRPSRTVRLLGWTRFSVKASLRQILKLRQPYVDRANTNARVMESASSHRFPKGGRIMMFSEFYTAQRLALFAHVLWGLLEDPMRRVMLLPVSGAPLFRQTHRAGRPCIDYTIECDSQAW